MPSRSDHRSVSPVIGAILMLAIVVALAATAGVLFTGLGDSLGAPPPFVANEESVQVTIDGDEASHSLQFAHRGGDAVDADDLSVRITAGGTTTRLPATRADGAALDDGEWSAGETLDLGLEASMVCNDGAADAAVELLYRGEEREYALSSETVPVERGQFVIDGASVEATTDYTANVKFVGTGWGSETTDAPVNVSVHVDDARVKAWEMVDDHDSVVGSYGVSRQDAGTTIEVRAAGKQTEGFCTPFGCIVTGHHWVRVSSTDNTDNVRVYRDGDSAPAFEEAGDQQSAASYVDPYVEDSEITLEDNQAIYLFDFNDPPNDYQDAVVLVSFFTQRETVGVHQSKARDVVLCPAETKSASPNGGDGNGGKGNAGNGNGN